MISMMNNKNNAIQHVQEVIMLRVLEDKQIFIIVNLHVFHHYSKEMVLKIQLVIRNNVKLLVKK